MSAILAASPAKFRVGKRRKPGIVLSYVVLGVAIFIALFGQYLTPMNPRLVDLGSTLLPPTFPDHILGTDKVGRDLLSQLMVGARTSLLIPLIIIVIATTGGVILGLIAGWVGGVVDSVLSRINEFIFAFPSLLVAMLAIAIFGPGLLAPAIGLTIAYMPYTARLVRNLVIQEKNRPYIEAYRVQGFPRAVIATRKLVPNISPTIITHSSLEFGYIIVDLAALSYLGLGAQPPFTDWGLMVADGQSALLSGAIWPVLFPGLAIVAVVIAVNVISDDFGDRMSGGTTNG